MAAKKKSKLVQRAQELEDAVARLFSGVAAGPKKKTKKRKSKKAKVVKKAKSTVRKAKKSVRKTVRRAKKAAKKAVAPATA